MLALLYLTMQVFNTNAALKKFIADCRANNKSIGFVPTMGALHAGHISLINRALDENDIVVCSIYVNPTQFNNPDDLENYPRTLETDIALLEKAKCSVVFNPETSELYPEEVVADNFDFEYLESIMEGKFRPGHFKGMATIVKRLLLAVQPDKAYFGEKDFQQLAIINDLVRREKIPVEIIGCPIVREIDGLAMSSRNVRLNAPQRHAAAGIYEALNELKERANSKDLNKSLAKAIETINAHPHLAVEYLEIVDSGTLLPINDWTDAKSARAFVAVLVGQTRLIDNILLY